MTGSDLEGQVKFDETAGLAPFEQPPKVGNVNWLTASRAGIKPGLPVTN